MTIKINCVHLSQQIELIDQCAERFDGNFTGWLFGGISNLLSEICFAVEEDEYVVFKREDAE